MPPMTIFGHVLNRGGTPARVGAGQRGLRTAGTTNAVSGNAHSSKQSGRQAFSGPPASNAGSNVYCFNQTINAGNTFTYPLTVDGDYIGVNALITPLFTSSTVSVDVLSTLAFFDIIAPDGTIVHAQPSPDFYLWYQRFGPYGKQLTVSNVASATVTTSATVNYQIPISLPASKGPYTVVWTAASTTGLTSVNIEMSLQLGGSGGRRFRYAFANVPVTPSNSGTNDLAPLAPIQDIELDELFLTGLTTNTSAVAFAQLQSAGSSVAPRVTGQQLVGAAAQYLTGSVSADYMYPLLALQTKLMLGRTSHAYFTWGSTAPSAPRMGFAWAD